MRVTLTNVATTTLNTGVAPAKHPSQYTQVGIARPHHYDIPEIVNGTHTYAANVRALAYAAERGAGEAIFANTSGNLCEATGSNVFVAKGGIVRTPPPSAGCLLGVTRALLLELCAKLDIPAQEADIRVQALEEADEAFLSSTTREAQAIAHVGGVALPAAPGPITQRLGLAFAELVQSELDP